MEARSTRPAGQRLTFHDAQEIAELDLSGLEVASDEDVDALHQEVDSQLAGSGRQWYLLINYAGAGIAAGAWNRFMERGGQLADSYSLGAARVGATGETRESLKSRARSDQTFRANLYDSRDSALLALTELRKRRQAVGEDAVKAYLSVDDVNLGFGGVKALDHVGFNVQRGEIFSIIGPNGAGKTSMLNVISGFYKPTSGRITFDGHDRTHFRPEAVARLGFARTFQNIALFKGMSTLDNIMTGRLLKVKSNFLMNAFYLGKARRDEMEQREHVEHVIDFLEIQPIRRTPVGRLPYGLQKRVELGRALAMEPKVLLLDEPMAGMNLEEKEDMARFILDVNDEFGTTMVLIEHDMAVVMDISTHVVVLDHGVKIAEGTPDEVRTDQEVINAYLGQG